MQPDQLIDRAHLDAQTFGDRALARELLQLFDQQCVRLLPGIADGDLGAAARADLAHTLKGSALGVGAARIAAASAAIEDGLRDGAPPAGIALDGLARAVEATRAEIGRIAAGGSVP
ncbi:MAG TPA: Hpt domain-containing protein [Geminicoccaceae bacterium]|jgi:HPt (histidine-containing phosphotransfer) domain-containing protein